MSHDITGFTHRGLSPHKLTPMPGVHKRGMKYDSIKTYTLDVDATAIEADKAAAKMTYKGFKGYMPMVGHLAENGLVIADEFREGNEAPAARNLEFLKRCVGPDAKGQEDRGLSGRQRCLSGGFDELLQPARD